MTREHDSRHPHHVASIKNTVIVTTYYIDDECGLMQKMDFLMMRVD